MFAQELSTQPDKALAALGFGFALGFLYDFFKLLRLCLDNKRPAVIICDIIFLQSISVAYFCFLLCVNEGSFRLYLTAFTALGCLIHRLSFAKFSERYIISAARTARQLIQLQKQIVKGIKKRLRPKHLRKNKKNFENGLEI